MSDSTSDIEDSAHPFAADQFSENVLEVFVINLPIVPSTRFSCHLCLSGQHLKTHNGLKKHFKNSHNNSVIIRFQCRQCEVALPSVKHFPSHAKVCQIQPPSPGIGVRSPLQEYNGFSPSAVDQLISEARARSSPSHFMSPHDAEPGPDPSIGVADIVLQSSISNVSLPLPPLPNLDSVSRVSPSPSFSRTQSPRGLPDSTLWEWEGQTNVLGAESPRRFNPGRQGRGMVGPGGLRHLLATPVVTPEIVNARRLLLPASSPPHPPATPQNGAASPPPTFPAPSSTPFYTPLASDATAATAELAAANDSLPFTRRTNPSPCSSPSLSISPPAPEWNNEFGHPTVRQQTMRNRPVPNAHPAPSRPTLQRATLPGRNVSGGHQRQRAGVSRLPACPPTRGRHIPAPRPRSPPNGAVDDNPGNVTHSPPTGRPVAAPQLTPRQTDWLARLDGLDFNDLDGLACISREIAALAVESQTDAGHQQRRQQRPDVPRLPPRTRRPAPARPRFDAGEASTIQKLYRTDRKKALYHIFSGPSPHCHIDSARIHRHLSDMFAGDQHVWSDPPPDVPNLSTPSSDAERRLLISPFTPAGVAARLSRMKNTAPGPDGARYSGLRRADPGCHVLAKLFTWCLRSGRAPQDWKDTTTILIHKAGDRENLTNWRPLSLGNTIGKLYAGVIADRVSSWATDGGRISAEQKGFTDHEGCLEHNFILQTAIEDARRRGEELCVAWLDLANAFGSVPHTHIFGTLRLLGLPEEMLAVIQDLYTGSVTRAMTPDGLTDPIPILSGVKQGCPLSPIVFDLAMEPLIRAVLALKESTGYRLLKQPPQGALVNILAYADDLTVLAKNEFALQKLIDVLVSVAEWCSLQFKPPKCASLHIDRRRSGQQEVLSTQFSVQESAIVTLQEGQHYRHLGVPTGFRNKQTPIETIREMDRKFSLLDESLLAPWQKIDAAITFLMPKLDFLMRGADIAIGPLNQLDRAIKRAAKKWLFLPQRASNEPVFMLPSQGGAGLLPLRDTRYAMAVVQGYRLLTCPDPLVQSLAWDSLRAVVRIKIGHAPSEEELADYLNGASKGDGGPRSFWARVRRSTAELRKKCNIRWFWSNVLKEMQFLVPKPGEEPDVARIHPAARRHICHQLRSAIRDHYIARLLRKPDQGKVHSIALRWSTSNHMMRTGAYTRFADWRFLHRARLDCVPLNGTRRFGNGSKQCRRCPHLLETLPHVLSCCLKHSTARQQRHHAIVHRLARAIPPSPGLLIREDRKVPFSDSPLRPDIVTINESKKELTIVDVAVIFENRYSEFQRARQQKIDKYTPLADSFRTRGWNVSLDAIVVGSLGSWDPANEPALKLLHIGTRYAKIMRRLIVSDTIRWSRDMYVEHITGVRQYPVNPTIPPPLSPAPVNPATDPEVPTQPVAPPLIHSPDFIEQPTTENVVAPTPEPDVSLPTTTDSEAGPNPANDQSTVEAGPHPATDAGSPTLGDGDDVAAHVPEDAPALDPDLLLRGHHFSTSPSLSIN